MILRVNSQEIQITSLDELEAEIDKQEQSCNDFEFADPDSGKSLLATHISQEDDGSSYTVDLVNPVEKGIRLFAYANKDELPDINWVKKIFTSFYQQDGGWESEWEWERISEGNALEGFIIFIIILLIGCFILAAIS